MINRSFLFFVILVFLVSCGKKNEQESNTSGNTTNQGSTTVETKTNGSENKSEIQKTSSPAIGSYSGGFTASVYNDRKDYVYENRITIFIDSLTGEIMYGRSIVAGNNRPFSGKFIKDGSNFRAEVNEPGDDKYDGKFSFTIKIDEAKTNEIYLEGKWIANDKKLDVTE